MLVSSCVCLPTEVEGPKVISHPEIVYPAPAMRARRLRRLRARRSARRAFASRPPTLPLLAALRSWPALSPATPQRPRCSLVLLQLQQHDHHLGREASLPPGPPRQRPLTSSWLVQMDGTDSCASRWTRRAR